MTTDTLNALAQQALDAWGGPGKAPRLVSHRENAVFEAHLKDGTQAALRLHRPGYNSVAEIQSELWWTHALAEQGFPAPKPIPSKSGDLLVQLGGNQVATVISWVDGAPIGATNDRLAGSLSDQIVLYRQVGDLLARLHTQSDALELPQTFTRRNWNADGFLGDKPLWGEFWLNPALTSDEVELVQSARTKAQDDLKAYEAEGADTGLIHADALRENVFQTEHGLTLIDFDDAGYGFRLFDLTTALSQSIEDDNYTALMDAVFEGYGKLRPLGSKDTSRVSLFAMLRTFASLGWVVPRLPADHPGISRYVRRATTAAHTYLNG